MNPISQKAPLVSIQCLVYNHEPYLRQCLDSFVSQQTTFPFEAIVHDDASTDGSAAIIHEYAEKYPNIIKPIYEEENQYSKGNGVIERIMNESVAPSSQFIALCEGDDYWTDPYKLQKQVDYMESNQDVVLCFHNAIAHWEDGRKPDSLFSMIEDRYYYYDEVFTAFIVPTASMLFHKCIFDTPLYKEVFTNPKRIVGDWPLLLVCASMGKIRGMSDCMSVYRRTLTGYTLSVGSQTVSYDIKAADMNYEFYKIFPQPYCRPCRFKSINYSFGAYSASKGTSHVRYDMIWKSFRRFPYHTIGFILKVLFKKFLSHEKTI